MIDEGAVAALLQELNSLGLVRVSSLVHEQPRFVLTSLGRQFQSNGALGQSAVTEQLAELERLRTDLLAAVGHELRTPLTAIRTSVGLLLDPTAQPDPETATQLLQTIARGADRMQRLLADLLDLARFRAGRIPLQCRRFNAVQLARDVALAMAPVLNQHGQSLDLVLPNTPVTIYGDHRRLEQVLLNLLSNAQKFSPDGSPLKLAVSAADGDILWSVTDQGPGIAPQDQARLFERFFTTASSPTTLAPMRPDQERSGAGLGLPIALAIVQAHGGSIEVDTALGRGSTFTVRIPSTGPSDLEDE
jgi:signal transduction histidine kinase